MYLTQSWNIISKNAHVNLTWVAQTWQRGFGGDLWEREAYLLDKFYALRRRKTDARWKCTARGILTDISYGSDSPDNGTYRDQGIIGLQPDPLILIASLTLVQC